MELYVTRGSLCVLRHNMFVRSISFLTTFMINRPMAKSSAKTAHGCNVRLCRLGLIAWCVAAVCHGLGVSSFTSHCFGGDWPHWRGPNRSDVIDEPSGYDGKSWNTQPAIWQANVGEGATSPIIVSDRLYVLGWQDDRDTLRCLDSATGKEHWKQSYPCPKHGRRAMGDEGLYSGPTATPEFDPASQQLYSLSTDGDLCSWDLRQTGRVVWKLNLYADYDVPQRPRHGRSGRRDYGYTTAPLVHEQSVIVEVGDETGTLMAFDKRTGKRTWSSECKDPAGHTGGIVPLTIEGIPCVAVLTYQGLLVARIDLGREGQTVAQYPWSTDFANNVATPTVFKNSVVITSEYNHQAMCRIDVSLKGAVKTWEQPFSSKVCSPIIHKGHVYWTWRKMHCLDFETGTLRWSGGSFGDAGSCVITQDDKLIVWAGQGKLALAEASPTAYRELSLREGLGNSDAWPHVVLANGRLYCKDRTGHLTCFKVRPEVKPERPR